MCPAAFNWDETDGAVESKPTGQGERLALHLKHGFELANGVAELQPYTWMGHVREFGPDSMVCVDHIFYDISRLRLACLVPPAPRECVEEFGAPSSVFASDHVAVVVDFDFVN